MPEPISIVPGKTDVDLAASYRAELTRALSPIAEILDRAKADGLSISFSVAPDQYGRFVLKEISVVKPL